MAGPGKDWTSFGNKETVAFMEEVQIFNPLQSINAMSVGRQSYSQFL